MRNPSPILLSRPHPRLDNCELQILPGEQCYYVTYDGEPINLRTEGLRRRYYRSAFSQRGSASLLARKLNALFSTNRFAIEGV